MKTKINLLNYSCNDEKLDEVYDFYHFRTTQKFISKGALFLDNIGVDAESIAFDFGISAFAMFKCGKTTLNKLNQIVNDNDIAIRKVASSDLKKPILLRLLFNSLGKSNFDEFSFNNLTGRLYYYLPEWISKNGKFIKALDVSTSVFSENEIRLDANACTFTKVSVFKKRPDFHNAFYEISIKRTLKRCANVTNENINDLFIRKTPTNKKTEIEFLNFTNIKKKSTKAYAIYNIIKSFNSKFNGLVAVELKELEILEKITTKRDEDFVEKSIALLEKTGLNKVNFCYQEENEITLNDFEKILSGLSKNICINESKNTNNRKPNIVLIHNKEYYQENGYEDPYLNLKRNEVIQCFTDEDVGSKISETIVKTIIKEIAIKNDIINERKITLDNWEDYHFSGPFSFGIIDNDVPYFLEIDADGSFKTIKPKGFLHSFLERRYEILKMILLENKCDNPMLIADDKGNVNLIKSTGINTYPYEEIFDSTSPRGKEDRSKFLAGITDINLYDVDGEVYYNVGIIGKGMNSSLSRGSLIYKVSVIKGRSIIRDLLETMSVMFVKYNSFTVLPYPFKYLKEWIKMETE